MNKPTQIRLRSAGFTLIELLTVIAIIGILAAIIIPTVNTVRGTARNAQCISQLREWGRIIQLYANENKGNYYTRSWASAVDGDAPGGISYRRYFTKAATESYRMRLCPRDPQTPDKLVTASTTSLTPTYAMVRGSLNGQITNVASEVSIPLGRARSPSQYMLMVDSLPTNVGLTGNNLQDLQNFIAPLAAPENKDRHGAKFNAVFGDGSVKRVGWSMTFGDTTSVFIMRTTWFQLN